MPAWTLLWLLGLFLAGIALFAWGVRGRRINRNPVCRQCRFDLSGQPPETLNCPECGRGLKRDGSVRIGQRKRRPLAIGMGVLAIVLPVAAVGAMVFAMITGADLNTYKPLSVLQWELSQKNGTPPRTIAAELLRRVRDPKTPRAEYGRIVDLAIALQADTARPWLTELGDIIEQADMDSRLSQERLIVYRKQASVLNVTARSRVRAGDSLPVIITLGQARTSTSTDLAAMVTTPVATLDGVALKVCQPPSDESRYVSPRGREWCGMIYLNKSMYWYGAASAGVRFEVPDSIAPGPHTLKFTFTQKNSSSRSGMAAFYGATGGKTQDPEDMTIEREIPIQVVAPSDSTVELVKLEPGARKLMESKLEPLRVFVFGNQDYYGYGRGPVCVTFGIADLPIGGDFDVELRTADKSWALGRLSTGKIVSDVYENLYGFMGSGSERTVSGAAKDLTGDSVDVILRPNAKTATQTTDLFRIYGDEIVFKDVEVSRPKRR